MSVLSLQLFGKNREALSLKVPCEINGFISDTLFRGGLTIVVVVVMVMVGNSVTCNRIKQTIVILFVTKNSVKCFRVEKAHPVI